MTDLVTLTANCEAFGHPSACTEPAPGDVQEESPASLTLTNAGGTTKQIASVDTADMHFDSHGHDTDEEGNCIQFETHDVDPSVTSSSLTLNNSPLYIVGDGVGTDPTTGGDIDIIDAGINVSLTEQP